jgi:hypothetical protein
VVREKAAEFAQNARIVRIPTNVTACTDERDRSVVRASVEFKF